ncbi:hypothetical protein Vadar_009062 [Vaccinium darrowii]|uniref:Uncharacterized protein n=1 Tax=Vaccinium darrowii TaxID=229202 RepID=A0ACB7YDN8_9ERIC|nr:hypothetical protein Vadar_009062 [Vaccinium darrowii]
MNSFSNFTISEIARMSDLKLASLPHNSMRHTRFHQPRGIPDQKLTANERMLVVGFASKTLEANCEDAVMWPYWGWQNRIDKSFGSLILWHEHMHSLYILKVDYFL